ncbi:hypothetical protein CSB09_01515 [Candidatus Gracilibacteria bacterium]|nr:MAG: hypothetical protein CSB09_01515 [Candidatus Gracilibacteria bacterium]
MITISSLRENPVCQVSYQKVSCALYLLGLNIKASKLSSEVYNFLEANLLENTMGAYVLPEDPNKIDEMKVQVLQDISRQKVNHIT